MLILIANALTVTEFHGDDISIEEDSQLIDEALSFTFRHGQDISHWRTLHTVCSELNSRARIARAKFALGQTGPRSVSVAWLEAEARRSAGYSARKLVEAFTAADQKPLTASLWRVRE